MNIDWIEVSLISCLVLVCIALGIVAYNESVSPNIILKKDAWECSKYKTIIRIQIIGKVLIPTPASECIQYIRKQG